MRRNDSEMMLDTKRRMSKHQIASKRQAEQQKPGGKRSWIHQGIQIVVSH